MFATIFVQLSSRNALGTRVTSVISIVLGQPIALYSLKSMSVILNCRFFSVHPLPMAVCRELLQ